MGPRTLVRRLGLPPFLSWVEAGGQAQGGPADASAELQKVQGERGTWAWNPLYGEWQLLHIIQSGHTLTRLANQYYGQSNLVNIRKIGHVEQNKPILGPSFNKAVPGDVILIPGLQQPSAQPPGSPGGGAQPPPGGTPGGGLPGMPPGGDSPTTPIDYLPTDPPPGWPPGFPWPPLQTTPPGGGPGVDPPPDDQPPPGPPADAGPPGAEPIQTGGRSVAIEKVEKDESWWTPTRIALVGVLGVGTIALITWGVVAASKKPRRPRRRTKSQKAATRRRYAARRR